MVMRDVARGLRVLRRLAALAAGLLQPLALGAAGEPNLILEAGFESPHGYVQAQALYALRFYQAIDVRELQLHDPVVALAELRPIGEDRIGEATRAGRRYRVTERRYAVFPFASGDLLLSGAHVTGLVAVPGATPPGARQPLRLDAPPATLAVLPIPREIGTGAWLPARSVTLAESWADESHEARAGEPLRRTLRIEAAGVDAAQLPALEIAAAGFAVHPEPPRLENRFEADLNVGIREQSFRVVPLQAGPLTVPALRLPWWDVAAGRPRVAELPARAVEVAPGAAFSADAAAQPQSDPPPLETPAAPPARPETSPGEGGPNAGGILAGLGGLALLAALAWGASRRIARARASPLRELHRACRSDDPQVARRALICWAAERWPEAPPRSLGALAERVKEPGMRAVLQRLDRHLYGPAGARWQGGDLAEFSEKRRTKTGRESFEKLPPLYPR